MDKADIILQDVLEAFRNMSVSEYDRLYKKAMAIENKQRMRTKYNSDDTSVAFQSSIDNKRASDNYQMETPSTNHEITISEAFIDIPSNYQMEASSKNHEVTIPEAAINFIYSEIFINSGIEAEAA